MWFLVVAWIGLGMGMVVWLVDSQPQPPAWACVVLIWLYFAIPLLLVSTVGAGW